MKKGAIELSTNFLVIMIISLVIFGSSLALTRKFFGKASDIKQIYDEKTESEIERLLDDGSRVAIPFDKKRISNGEFATFGIGILNALNIGTENDFRLRLSFKGAFDKNSQPICTSAPCDPNGWLKTAEGVSDSNGVSIDKTIKNNQQQKVLLGVEVKKAPPGTYIFDVKVCYFLPSGTLDSPPPSCTENGYRYSYGNLKKIYVDVP